jgi:alkaline phosphatase D
VPVAGIGTLNLRLNLFDYTMAGNPPTLDALAEGLRIRLRSALAASGVAEAALDATTTAVLAGLKADPAFSTQLLGLAGQLAGISANPWIRWASTDIQGYGVVTLTATEMVCQFRALNRLVGSTAPASGLIARTVTARIPAGTAAVTISRLEMRCLSRTTTSCRRAGRPSAHPGGSSGNVGLRAGDPTCGTPLSLPWWRG